MTKYPSSWKQCATCAFWTGPRQCGTFNQDVAVDSGSTQGKCAIPSGGWKGQQRQASSTCSDYKKWQVLK